MAKEDNKEKKNIFFENLENQFDLLIKSNPYLLYLTQKEDSRIKSKYNQFKKYEFIKSTLFIILGFVLSILAFGIYYVYSEYISNSNNQFSAIPEFFIKATPIIYLTLTILVLIWTGELRTLLKRSELFASVCLTIITGIATFFSFKGEIDNEVLFIISPLIGYLIIIIALGFIHQPLSSRTLKNSIIKETKTIRDELKTINKSLVEESHKKVLNKIVELEKKIKTSNQDLFKFHAISILDSLRLELIKNSINGITLVEDWKFLDLSQNMIDEIRTCENKKITILGDMSFLSTKEGLKKLVDSILEDSKSYEIFFVGSHCNNRTVQSPNCETFVKNFKNEYCNHQNIEKIIRSIKLKTIFSESFTGIGFIGLRADNDDEIEREFEKVFAYVTSLLIPEKDVDITRANPFVFSWREDDKRTGYFKSFLKSKSNEVNGNDMISKDMLDDYLKRIKKECISDEECNRKRILEEIENINKKLEKEAEEIKVLIDGKPIKLSKLLKCN